MKYFKYILFNHKMGGGCSSANDDFNNQEQFVRKNFKKYNDKFGSKYSREKIESKLRSMYFNSDNYSRNIRKK